MKEKQLGLAEREVTALRRRLSRRTQELATANRQLRRGVRRRKSVEMSLKESGAHYRKLLRASLQLQEGLRLLTHEVLAAEEEERKKMSHELRDVVAQTLLGINVRLVALKQEARSNTQGLKKEIASAQRLVAESAQSARRAARDLRKR